MYCAGDGEYKHIDGSYSELHCGRTVHPIVIELERYKNGKSSLQEAFINIYMYSKGDDSLYSVDKEISLSVNSLESIALIVAEMSQKD